MRTNEQKRSVMVKGARVLAAALLAGACGGTASNPRVGSESHFLSHCAGTCQDGLDCIGGICTRACLTGTSSCSDLDAAATCTNQSVEPGEAAVCDVACAGPADCQRLGGEHTCEGSFCRTSAAPNLSTAAPSTREVSCQPYLDDIPRPDVRGLSIVNTGSQVLHLQQLALCSPSGPVTSLVRVERDGETVNTLSGGCARSCQEAFDQGWDVRFEAGPTDTECAGLNCIAVPRVPIQPGETLFQRAGLEVVFQRMPRECAEGIVTEAVNCYSSVVPARGNYVLSVLAFREPDCEGITNCELPGSCGACAPPSRFSVPSEWSFDNQTLSIGMP